MTAPRHPDSCAYCGASAPTTRDHIPPKALFPKPRPRLITVPACHSCNQSFSKDDEYFRIAILTGDYERDYPKILEHSLEVIRRFSDPKKEGFKRMLTASIRVLPKSPSGTVAALEVDPERVLSVVERIAAGLYFHHFFRRVPEHHERSAGLLAGWVEEGMKDYLERLSLFPFHELADGAFRYRYELASDGESSVWELEFLKIRRFVFLNCPAVTPSPAEAIRDPRPQ